jgi:hypothetical protein
MGFIRKISPLDCSFLAGDSAERSSMVNQYVVQGIGFFSQIELREAIEIASQANLGIHSKLKGIWAWRYWDSEGEYPNLRILKDDWDGVSSEGASFDGKPIDCRKGPIAEVCLYEGQFPTLVFRTHHAVMDGNATLFWIREFFKALRQETLIGSEASLNEWEISKTIKKPVPEGFTGPFSTIFPASDVSKVERHEHDYSDCIWQNVVFEGRAERILPKAIAFINKKTREIHADNKEIKVIVRVPSDLRRFLNADSTYQLTNMVAALDLEISAQEIDKTIFKRILKGLKNNVDLSIYSKFVGIAKYLPKSVFQQKAQHFLNNHQQGISDITAIVTHVGKVSLDEISTTDFKATNIYALPVPLEGVSLSCVFVEHSQGVSLCMSAPRVLASHQELKKLAIEMQAELFDNQDGV